jgi:hypothetical protein
MVEQRGIEPLTSALRIRLSAKTLSICLFESCSHRRKIEVFPFFPIPYHLICVACSYFWTRIGHLEIGIDFFKRFEIPDRPLQ